MARLLLGQQAMPNFSQLDRPPRRAGAPGFDAGASKPPASSGDVSRPNRKGLAQPRLALLFLAVFSLVGVAFAVWLRDVPAGTPDPRLWYNAFFVLFARNEPLGLGLVAFFSVGAALILFRKRGEGSAPLIDQVLHARWFLPVILAGVFAICAVGTHLVCHNYALTADENLADFQAKIFLRGQTQAKVPEQWLPVLRNLKPTFVAYHPETNGWNSQYLPVYAAMRAVFQSVQLQSLLNAFLAAISILALYGTARNIWPEKKENAVVAAILLASSSQFLIMAMTSYAMPAHLALNTVWLWLYTRPGEKKFYLAPLVGILAIGLHQPVVHALFVTPFLFRLVLQQKWKPTVIFAAIYLLGCAGWYSWSQMFQGQAPAGVGSIFKLLNPRMAIIQPMSLLLVIGWASLATPLLAALGYGRFFRLSPFLQDAAVSFLLTFGFYYFFYLDQAHGWGYRYVHGSLGCLVLIAVAGWERLSEMAGNRAANMFAGLGVALSLLLLLPLRCVEAESFVRPYARTAAAMHALPADIVAFDPFDAWYSADLLRNDPYLENRPLVVALAALSPEAIATLEKAGEVRRISREAMARFGMHTKRHNDFEDDPFTLGRGL